MFHLPARVKRGNVSSALNEIILIILWCKLWCNPFVWLSVFFSQLESLYVFVPHCFFVFFYDTSISDCSSLHQLNCNDSVLYEKAMECEDQGADSFANDNNHDCRWEETLATWQFWLKEGEFTQPQQTKQLTLVLFSIAARRRQETENAWKKVLLATLFARQMFSFWIKPKKLFTGHWVMSDCFATRWT